MNASRRYLPLSLMLLLATSVGSANAGSFLDPYSHIKAPAGTAPKKKFLQQDKEPAIVPRADEVTETKTYVMAPLGEVAEEGAPKNNAGHGGLLSKTMAPFKKAGSSVAKSGSVIANGAKASAGMAKKSGSMIGFKGDKNKIAKEPNQPKEATNPKIAAKPKVDNAEKIDNKKKSPSHVASVDDWYTRETEKAIAHKDDGSLARKLVKQDPSSNTGKQTAFLERKGGKKLAISSKLNPFNKFGKKSSDKDANNQIDIRPASGFVDGAANPDEEVLAELEREKAAKLAAKELKEGSKESFTPIVNTPEPAKKQQIASNSKPEKEKKKSKFGLNVNIAKLKPGMPSMPSFGKGKKKQQPNTSIAAAPKKEIKKSELDKLTEVEPIAKIDPAGEEDIAPAGGTPSMAFRTGDKAIDAATPKGPVAAKQEKNETVVAKKPAKKGKFGMGMSMANLSKFNFMNKKKQPAAPQSATKSDASTKQL